MLGCVDGNSVCAAFFAQIKRNFNLPIYIINLVNGQQNCISATQTISWISMHHLNKELTELLLNLIDYSSEEKYSPILFEE